MDGSGPSGVRRSGAKVRGRGFLSNLRARLGRQMNEVDDAFVEQYSGRLHDIDGRLRGPVVASARRRRQEQLSEREVRENVPTPGFRQISESEDEEYDHEECDQIESNLPSIPVPGRGKGPMRGNYEHRVAEQSGYEGFHYGVEHDDEDAMEEDPTYSRPMHDQAHGTRHDVDTQYDDLLHSMRMNAGRVRGRRMGQGGTSGAAVGEGSRRTHSTTTGSEGEDDSVWELRGPIEGGPVIPELLAGFLGHVAYSIWHGKERGVLKVQSRYSTLRSWQPNREDMSRLIQRTGLSHLPICMHRYIDDALISAFVERWHPETNSFHMPFGEMTITLHDVHYLLRIPVEGLPIIVDETVDNVQIRVSSLLNMSLEEVRRTQRGGSIKFKVLEERLSGPNVEKDAATRGYLLWMLGATLFVDKTGNCAPAFFLPLLNHLKKVRDFAWGAGGLAHLYRSLGTASRSGGRQISGCLSLLQV